MPEWGLGSWVLDVPRWAVCLGRRALRPGARGLRLRRASLGLLLGHLVGHPWLLSAVRMVRDVRVLSTVALVPAPPASVLSCGPRRSGVPWHADSPYGRSPCGISCTNREAYTAASDVGDCHAASRSDTIGYAWAGRHGADGEQRGNSVTAWRSDRNGASAETAADDDPWRDTVGSYSWIFGQAAANAAVVQRLRVDAELELVRII